MPRRDGIDVSKWQGTIDWGAVAASGITWSACRVWDRDLHTVDPTFAANRAGQSFARHRLLYHWLVPGESARGADQVLATVGQLQRGEALMLDAEQDGITEAECLDWLARVEAATGRPAAVYTGGYVAGGAIWTSARIFDGTRPRILAAYCSEADARMHAKGIPWDVWQFSASGRVPGIAANCDEDQVDNAAAFDAPCGWTAEAEDASLPAEIGEEMFIITAPNSGVALVAIGGAGVTWSWIYSGEDQTAFGAAGIPTVYATTAQFQALVDQSDNPIKVHPV